jgi:adenylate cyclase
MINPRDLGSYHDKFLNQIMSHWGNIPNLFDSYTSQRQRFMLKRMQLQAQIMMVVVLTLIGFFLWVNNQLDNKLSALTIGLIIELFILCCWFFCQNRIGRRYPHLIFLCLCWSVTCAVQIDIAILFNHIEPRVNMWMLMFVTQATIIPVTWRLHLISQIGTIICYAFLYLIYHPVLQNPSVYYFEQGLYLFWTCIICNMSVILYEQLRKNEYDARIEMEAAQQKSERLLLNILPEMIANQLKQEQTTIADSFGSCSVLFADIVGFTELSSHTSPASLVELLNEIFSMFDKLAERHGVEKIKTIGDAYMAVAGLPIQRHDHAESIANMALDMQLAIQKFNQKNNSVCSIRVCISMGPVVAGVIGLKKFAYDLWGDTVNIASRMESHGIPGCIQVCQQTYECLKDKYIFEQRGVIKIKGKGEMMTYLLKGKLSTNMNGEYSC